jgi:hypothetical protein
MTTITMPLDISESSGDTACFVSKEREKCYGLLQESTVLRFVETGTLQQLYIIYKECSSAGWDGEQAIPISLEVLKNALKFLFSFPSGIEAPVICAEPDGAITLEWYRSPNKVISISINPDGLVYWAALIGARGRHGKDRAMLGVHDDLLRIILNVIESDR